MGKSLREALEEAIELNEVCTHMLRIGETDQPRYGSTPEDRVRVRGFLRRREAAREIFVHPDRVAVRAALTRLARLCVEPGRALRRLGIGRSTLYRKLGGRR